MLKNVREIARVAALLIHVINVSQDIFMMMLYKSVSLVSMDANLVVLLKMGLSVINVNLLSIWALRDFVLDVMIFAKHVQVFLIIVHHADLD